MELTDFSELVLLCYLAGDVQLACLRVEVDGPNPDQEGCVDAVRGCAAGCGLGGDTAEGRGAEEVRWADEVVGVPLRVLDPRQL